MRIRTNIKIGEKMTNHVIGIKLADGSFYPILQEGNPEKKTLELTTVHDGQTKVEVHLYKSETESMENAEYVDTLVIENLVPHEKQTPSLLLNIAIDDYNNLSAEIADSETGAHSDLAVSLMTLAENVIVPETSFTLSETPLEEDYHNSFTLAEESSRNEEVFSEPTFDTIPDIDEASENLSDLSSESQENAFFADSFTDTFDTADTSLAGNPDSSESLPPENEDTSSFDTFFVDTENDHLTNDEHLTNESFTSEHLTNDETFETEPTVDESFVTDDTSFVSPEFVDTEQDSDNFENLPTFDIQDVTETNFESMDTDNQENFVSQDFDSDSLSEETFATFPDFTTVEQDDVALDALSLDDDSQNQEAQLDGFSFDSENLDSFEEDTDDDFSFIKDEDLPPQEEDFKNPFETEEQTIIESSASISELDNLPDFSDEPFSISSIDIGDVPQDDFSLPQEMYSFNDSDFDSLENSSILSSDNSFEKTHEPLSSMNFTDLYDEERIKGTTMSDEKVSKGAVVICVICAIISVAAALAIFFLPKKTQVQENSQVVIEESVEIDQPIDTSVPLQELAKEEEIIIVETPIVKPELVEPAQNQGITYKIKWGDTLWDLSDTYYQNPWLYKKIAKYNNIQNPNLIISGTYIVIPPK